MKTASGEINMEQGAEGGLARENVKLQKLVAILVLYDARVLSQCQNWSGAEMILSYVKTNLQVHLRD